MKDFQRIYHLDWPQCSALENRDSEAGAEWVFKGTRIAIKAVFDNLAAGMPTLEISRIFGVKPESMAEVPRFAGESLPTESDLRRRIKNNRTTLAKIGILPTLFLVSNAFQMEDSHPVIALGLWVCSGGMTLILLTAALPFRRLQLLLLRRL